MAKPHSADLPLGECNAQLPQNSVDRVDADRDHRGRGVSELHVPGTLGYVRARLRNGLLPPQLLSGDSSDGWSPTLDE
jgi:hypothetical protein